MMKRRAFVVRIWLNDADDISGQISDPLTDWRHPFTDSDELWRLIRSFMTDVRPEDTTAVSPTPSSADTEPNDDG